jgi:hypothetical protein
MTAEISDCHYQTTACHLMYPGNRPAATVGIVGDIVAHGEDMRGSTPV